MYTGEADHSLTAELVQQVDVPVIASGDVTSRARVLASIVAVVILGAVFGVLVVDSAGAPVRDAPVAPAPGAVDPLP